MKSNNEVNNDWIYPVMIAVVLFFLCDVQLSVITSAVDGIDSWFYTSSGAIFCTIMFNLGKGFKNRKVKGTIWNE